MAQREALLQCILANPDEDAPRLAFADWLECQEGAESIPRGEFVRVQIKRARLLAEHRDQKTLQAREKALLQAHHDAWVRDLPPWAGGFTGGFHDPDPERARFPFRRGFVSGVQAAPLNFVEKAPELWAVEPVTGLRTRLYDGTTIAARAARDPDDAQRMRCYGPLAVDALVASPHLANLTTLFVDEGSPLGAAGVRSLAGSPFTNNLQRLTLFNQAINDDALRELAASEQLARLTTLDLVENTVSALGVQALLTSRVGTRLTALGLRQNELDSAGARALAGIPSLARITRLDLARNAVGDQGAKALADSPYVGALTYLDLSENGISDVGLQALAASPHLSNLRVLKLPENDFADAGAKALAASSHLANLTILELWWSSIGDEGALALAASPYLGNLMRLILYPGPGAIPHFITQKGAQALWDRFGDRVTLGVTGYP